MKTSRTHQSKCAGRSLPSITAIFLAVCSLALAGCTGLVQGSSTTNPPPSALTISNPGSSNGTATSAAISWQTNVPATSQVEYGTTTSYGSSTAPDSTMLTSHQENLTSLKPATTYHFRVHSTDANYNTAVSGDSTFSTTPDTTAPAVSITAPANGATVSGTVTVTADGTDNVSVASVQFQLDGARLGSLVTTAPYSVSWDTTKSTGGPHTLSAIARDAAGNNATSASVTVTVNNATGPTITTQPGNQIVTAGQTATFTVVATGTVPLAYQWQKNGANISGATSVSYTTPATTTADSGSAFAVVVTNTAGTVTSAAATLTVNPAPVAPAITTQPVNQTVTAGQTATFTVVATGTAPLGYQWQKNGASIAGATAASYTTPATTTADSGSAFTVVVTNTAGTVTSAAATLTVNPAPVAPAITSQPANQTVTAGQTATFTVVATGTAPLSYQWHKNGANISGATSASYTTPATTSTDNGSTFRAVVSNSVGSVTSNASTLTLNAVAPLVVSMTSPTNGASVSGTITVSGTASDSVAVTLVQLAVDSGSFSNASGTNNWSFSLNTVLLSNATHTLTAKATDSSGNTATSIPVSITVNNSSAGSTATVDWTTIHQTITGFGAATAFQCGSHDATGECNGNGNPWTTQEL